MCQYDDSTEYRDVDVGKVSGTTIKEKFEALERLAGILKDENRDLKTLIRSNDKVLQKILSPSRFPDNELSFNGHAGMGEDSISSHGQTCRATWPRDRGFVRVPRTNSAENPQHWPSEVSALIIDAQERERKRISMDLHDGVCQSLVGIRMLLEIILSEIETDGPVSEMIRQAFDTARKTENDIRSVMEQLQPPNLKEQGLKDTIEQTISTCNLSHSRTDFRSQITTEPGDVPEHLQVVIYRVIQEAINNILKHSGARTARIALNRTGGKLRLIIEDDGDGFDGQVVLNTGNRFKGMGIMSMRDRVYASCGTFACKTEVGGGTSIVCEWDPERFDSKTD